jgi:hypothetical protein
VNADHLVAAFCGDDSFDFDQGYRGSLQYLFTIQANDGELAGDKAIEWDGATSPVTATPISDVTVSNLTAIGVGTTGSANAPINPRDNATVKLYNSVFVNYANGIEIESDIGAVLPDIQSNVFFSHIAENNTTTNFGTSASGGSDLSALGYFTDSSFNNVVADPMLNGISYTALSQGLDPRPSGAESPVWTTSVFDVTGEGLDATTYVGAFGDSLWISGWTNLETAGFLAPSNVVTNPEDTAADDASIEVAVVRGSTSKPVNLATRGPVGTGVLNSLTAGFVITGSQTQTVLIRVAGATLGEAPFNLPGTLSAAQVSLFRSSDVSTPIDVSRVVRTQSVALSAEVGAFPLTAASGDATIVAVLAPGAYTAQVTGVDGATGLAIVEVYELD